MTACLVPHTVIPLLHNLQLTHFCVTQAEASAPCFPCTAERERQFTLGEADTLKTKALESQVFWDISLVSSLSHSAAQVRWKHKHITSQSCETKDRNNSQKEERASSVNIVADYGWHFLKSGTVWFYRATNGTVSMTFTCSRLLFNIATSSVFTRCFVVSDGGTIKHVNESISRRSCHMFDRKKSMETERARAEKNERSGGAGVNKRQRGAASFFFSPSEFFNWLSGFSSAQLACLLHENTRS